MNARFVRFVALLGMVGVAAACGDDDPVNTGDTLSQSEAEDLAGVVLTTVVATTSEVETESGSGAASAPALVPFSYTSTFETVADCPLGGELALAGSIDVSGDDETGAQRLEYAMTHAHNGCSAESEQGRIFTLTGSPNVVVDVVAEAIGETGTAIDGSIVGAVAWELDDREGTCAITLDFDATAGDESVSMELSGSVCGVTVTESLSVG